MVPRYGPNQNFACIGSALARLVAVRRILRSVSKYKLKCRIRLLKIEPSSFNEIRKSYGLTTKLRTE